MIPGWSLTKVVQTVPVDCISRSRGQQKGFHNAIFKSLVQNYKAHNIHIWYIASSRGHLPTLFKLCPWDQKWPCRGAQWYIELYKENFLKRLLLNRYWEFDHLGGVIVNQRTMERGNIHQILNIFTVIVNEEIFIFRRLGGAFWHDDSFSVLEQILVPDASRKRPNSLKTITSWWHHTSTYQYLRADFLQGQANSVCHLNSQLLMTVMTINCHFLYTLVVRIVIYVCFIIIHMQCYLLIT